jgi:acyl CoA:acetate/3-ketoacid CoA transferase beta subunit
VDGGDVTADVFTVWLDGVGAAVSVVGGATVSVVGGATVSVVGGATVSVVGGAAVSVVGGVDKISVIIKVKVADGVEK